MGLDSQELRDTFNAWATGSQLRDDLDKMIEQGFEPSKLAKVSKVLKEGSPPATAIVTLEEPTTKGSPNQKRTAL